MVSSWVFEGNQVRLNIGGGKTEIPGYINVDHLHGLEAYPLDYPDGSAEEIRASHILEHFPFELSQEVIKDWVRVLAPGGSLQIAVPNLDRIFQYYAEEAEMPVEGYLMGAHANPDDNHKAIFNARKLRMLMEAAGLVGVREWKSAIQDCASLPVSLNLMGDKLSTVEAVAWGVAPDGPPAESPQAARTLPRAPRTHAPCLQAQTAPPGNSGPRPDSPQTAPTPTGEMKVIAVMSVPRLAFQDNMFCMVEAAISNHIALKKFSGAFWGQCLERSIVAAIDEGADAVMAVDYDSVFPREAVGRLIDTMQRHPEADAIAALQVNRRTGYPLLSVDHSMGEVNKDDDTLHVSFSLFDPELTELTTAHFGLTMIRTAALQKMPHPWFWSTPNKGGRWDEGRVDDDIYFWHKWLEAGHTVYSANRIPIAHAELMLQWPSPEFKTIYQHPSDFHEKGAPEGVWA